MADTTRGTTETVGALLLTAIAVTAVSLAAGAMFVSSTPVDQPQASIGASVDGGELTVEHRGGTVFEYESIEIAVDGADKTFQPSDAIADAGDGNAKFEPGESLAFSLGPDDRPESVALVYLGAERVVVDTDDVDLDATSTVTTTATTEPVTTTERSTPTETPSTTERSPGFTVEQFRVVDVSNAHAVRFEVVWRIAGDYDDVVFGLYRAEGGDWVDVAVDDPGLLERFFGLDARLVDQDHDEGTYRVVMWVTDDGETKRYVDTRTVEGRGNGDAGGPGGQGGSWWRGTSGTASGPWDDSAEFDDRRSRHRQIHMSSVDTRQYT